MMKFRDLTQNSLSNRLMLYSFLFTYVLLIGFWAVLFFSLKQSLRQQDEEILKDRIGTVRSILKADQGPSERLSRRIEKEWYERDFERLFVRVLDADAHVLIETPYLHERHAQVVSLLENSALDAHRRNRLTRFETDKDIYQISVFEVTVESPQPKTYIVEMALERANEQNLLTHFRVSFVFLLIVGGAASLWSGRAIVRIALRPIRDVSAMAARVNSESLNERIDPANLPTEFKEVAVTMNDMLDRLSKSFAQLTRFSEDMAHELRTPVNNLLGSMEVGLSRERAPEEYRNLLGSGIEECGRLKRVIDSLLFIARSSQPHQAIEKQNLNLHDELVDILSFYEASAEEKNIELKLEGAEGSMIFAERTHLQRCIGNLLANSIRHSPRASQIILRVLSSQERLVLQVIDHGCGLPEEALSRVGERFFRVEPSRAKIYGGTGLGLSIVKSIVELHGGKLDIASREGIGTTVSLSFPI